MRLWRLRRGQAQEGVDRFRLRRNAGNSQTQLPPGVKIHRSYVLKDKGGGALRLLIGSLEVCVVARVSPAERRSWMVRHGASATRRGVFRPGGRPVHSSAAHLPGGREVGGGGAEYGRDGAETSTRVSGGGTGRRSSATATSLNQRGVRNKQASRQVDWQCRAPDRRGCAHHWTRLSREPVATRCHSVRAAVGLLDRAPCDGPVVLCRARSRRQRVSPGRAGGTNGRRGLKVLSAHRRADWSRRLMQTMGSAKAILSAGGCAGVVRSARGGMDDGQGRVSRAHRCVALTDASASIAPGACVGRPGASWGAQSMPVRARGEPAVRSRAARAMLAVASARSPMRAASRVRRP